jgi:plastocyanin
VRFFARRAAALRVVLALGLALGSLLAACSGASSSESAGASPGATVVVTDGVAELSAANLVFDATVIQAPAGEPFIIRFTNDDTAPHNVSVFVQEGGDEIVIGDIIDGGQATDTAVPALEPGTYYFQCDLHPDMKGTVVVEG